MSKLEIIPIQGYDYQPLHDIEEEEKLTSRLTVMKDTSILAIKLLGTFTYSAQLPALLVMWGSIQIPNTDNSSVRAATSLSTTVLDIGISSLIYPLLSILFVGGPIYSQIKNSATVEEQKKLKKDFSRLVKNGLILALPFAIASALILFFSEYILVNWFGQNEIVSAISQQFLRPMAFLIPLYTLRFCLQPLFYIHQKMNWMIAISLTSFFAFGIFLADGLGFGHFSLPAKGILGIFYGLMAENTFTTLGLVACLFTSSFKDYRFSASFLHCFCCDAEDRKQLLALMKKGGSLVVTFLFEIITIFLKNVLAGLLGTNKLAVQDLSGQVSLFFLFIAHGYSQSNVVHIDDAHGGNKSRYARYGLLSGFLASLIPFLIVSIFPQILTILADPNTINDEVMSLSGRLIRWAAGTSVLNTIALIMLQSLRTTSNDIKPTAAFILWLWLSVLASYLLGFKTKLGVIGIGIGSFLGTGLGTLHVYSFWKKEFPIPIQRSRIEAKRQLNLQMDSNPEPTVSSWRGCFLRPMNRLRNWYYGTSNNIQQLNNFVP